MPFLSVNSFVGLGIEGTRGTASSNIKFIPISTPMVTPQQKWLRDEAFRGSPGTVYNEVLGVRTDEFTYKGYAFTDTLPVLLKAALGYEAVTGAGPYVHTMSLINAPTTGSQPPALTLQDFDGANPLQSLGTQLDTLKLTFGAEKAFEWETKILGQPFTVMTTNPTSSFSTEQFIPGWDLSATIGGTAVTQIVDATVEISRGTSSIYTAQGTNSPYRIFAGPIDVKGTMKLILENTDSIIYGSSNSTTVASSPAALSQTATASIPVASITPFNAGGGVGMIFHAGAWYSFTYTGASTGNVTGAQLVNGPGFTPTTGDITAPGSLALTDQTKAVALTLTEPSTAHSIAIQMSQVQFKDPKRSRGTQFVEIDVAFEAELNTTDAVAGAGGGYSPVKITATNAVSAAY